jgi:hypothetical protein
MPVKKFENDYPRRKENISCDIVPASFLKTVAKKKEKKVRLGCHPSEDVPEHLRRPPLALGEQCGDEARGHFVACLSIPQHNKRHKHHSVRAQHPPADTLATNDFARPGLTGRKNGHSRRRTRRLAHD